MEKPSPRKFHEQKPQPSREESASLDRPVCPLCQGGTLHAFSKGEYVFWDCTRCHHRFSPLRERESNAHVDTHYGDDYFEGGGAGYADYLQEGRLLRDHGMRYGKLLARWMRPGNVLDVGSAAGFFLKGLIDSGWKGTGVEPNAKMASHARVALGVQVETGSFEAYVSGDRFDLVAMVQVIAHFIDPRKVLRKAFDHLQPDGHLLVETWNRNSWTAKLFGRSWHEYSPPTVLHWFDKAGLRALAESEGFEFLAVGRPTKWLDGAHAKSLLRHVLGGSKARFLLPVLRIVPDALPIPYPSEDLMWMLFRKKGGQAP